MANTFNPARFGGNSRDGWIGDFPNIKAVQKLDDEQLLEIGGSYGVIADRMQQIWVHADRYWNSGKGVHHDEWQTIIDPIIDSFEKGYGNDWAKNPEIWEKYSKKWIELKAKFPQTHLDEKVAVLQVLGTRGMQLCPFENCGFVWNEDVLVVNRATLKPLTINRGTIHLAREHHFLEKGNKYGISAREFYDAFM